MFHYFWSRAFLVSAGAASDDEPLASATAGETCAFEMEARDEFGNARGIGGETFIATFIGAESVTAVVTDHGDGFYRVGNTAKHSQT